MNPFVWGLLVVLGLIIVVALGVIAYVLWDLWKLESKPATPTSATGLFGSCALTNIEGVTRVGANQPPGMTSEEWDDWCESEGGTKSPREPQAEDGECQHCGGKGCVACSARFLPDDQDIALRENPDALLVAELSRENPTLAVPVLAAVVEYVRCWENPYAPREPQAEETP